MNRTIPACMLILGCGLVSTGASADPDPEACSADQHSNCLDGVSSTVTGFDSLRVSMTQFGGQGDASPREDSATSSTLRGLVQRMTGDGPSSGIGTWVSVSHSAFELNVPNRSATPSPNGRIRYTADLLSLMLGADKQVGDGGLLGAAIGREERETKTEYNGGSEDTEVTVINAYLIWPFTRSISGSLVVSYASGETDQTRIDPDDGQTLSARFDSSRSAAIASLQGQRHYGDWLLSGHIGLLHAADEVDGYQESAGQSARTVGDKTVELTQAYIGADLSYLLAGQDLYGFATYRYDLDSDDGSSAGGLPGNVGVVQPDDDDEFELGLGWRFFTRGGVSGGLEYLQTFGRQKFDNRSVALLLRKEF